MRKKIIIGILIIALISVTSVAYAFLSENANVSSVDNTNIANNNNIPVNTDNSVQVYDNQNNNPLTQNTVTDNQYSSANTDGLVYVGLYAHYAKSEGITDYYIKCVECGGYIPIGEVTTPLPDAALCHGFNGGLSGNYKNFAVSYDDAYNTWVEYGMPVYDDGSNLSVTGNPIHQHLDNPEELVEVDVNPDNDMPLVDLTPCDDSITHI